MFLRPFIQIAVMITAVAVMLGSAACHKVTPLELQTQLKAVNPQWEGDFYAGYYANYVPVFEFTDGPSVNAVAISGTNVKDFSPLNDVCLRIFCLRESDLTDLNFLPRLNWEPEAVVELQNCRKLTDFSGLKALPLTIASISNTPFSDTSLLGSKLLSIYLNQTNVKKLNFTRPEIIEELLFVQKKGAEDADIGQVSKMERLVALTLKNRQKLDGLDFRRLQYLESLMLSHIDQVKLPGLIPYVISNIWLEDCKDLIVDDVLNNKVIDRLCLMRCGDPAKILAKLTNTKINLLVINGAHVSDLAFLKRIKDLKCVRFQNCTGLPDKIHIPFVEVIVEKI